jgi:hypothetical protein
VLIIFGGLKLPSNEFHENPLSGLEIVTWKHRGGQKLIRDAKEEYVTSSPG